MSVFVFFTVGRFVIHVESVCVACVFSIRLFCSGCQNRTGVDDWLERLANEVYAVACWCGR